MNWIGIFGTLAALLTPSSTLAWSSGNDPVVGDQHQIVVSYETSQRGTDGSSGSSNGHNALVERVVAVSDEGLELEFDLPLDASAEDRASVWKYPVRVLQYPDGEIRLLNRSELEGRVDAWLGAAGLTREMCGRWIFTWNAFLVECDPDSAIADIEAINLLSVDLREAGSYRHPGTVGAASLIRTEDGKGGSIYSVTLAPDLVAVRRARAENDVAVGEIIQQPVTLDAAMRSRSEEEISGTMAVTYEVDASGDPTRRVVTTVLKTVKPDGVSQTETQKVTVERRAL